MLLALGIPNACERIYIPNAFPVNAAESSRVVIITLLSHLSWVRWLRR